MQSITTQLINQSYDNDTITVLTEQPSAINKNILHTKELTIDGFITTLDQRKLQFFQTTGTSLAYSQQVYYNDCKPSNLFCCKSPCIDGCYSGSELTIVYPDEIVEKIKINPSWFASKDIAFSSNNYAIIVLDNSKVNSSLSLIKLTDFVEDSTSTNRFEINLPQENILAAGINANNDIYTTGIENNNLCVWITSTALENHASEKVNWEQLPIDLPADSIKDVAFSENSKYLFVRLKTGILNVYEYNQTWNKIAETTGTTTFPVDISEVRNKNEDRYKNKKLMVFIEGKKLIIQHETIKGKTNDIFYHENFSDKLITARFIPRTKDTLIFDSAGNIHLAKYDNIIAPSFSVRWYYSTKIPYTISKVYFDPTDTTKLNVLAEKKAASLLKQPCEITSPCCTISCTAVAPIIYGIATGFPSSCLSWCMPVYGFMAGMFLDCLDGYIDKSYFDSCIACINIKKTITPGNYIEPKALHPIQQSMTRL